MENWSVLAGIFPPELSTVFSAGVMLFRWLPPCLKCVVISALHGIASHLRAGMPQLIRLLIIGYECDISCPV